MICMNKHLYFLFLFLLFCTPIYAQHVTEEQALQKAQNFMQSKLATATDSKNRAPRKLQRLVKAAENDAYYIFNAEDNGGFVIVSGDERTDEILGYSTEGNINLNKMPENMKAWLKGYEEQILAIPANAKAAPAKVPTHPAVEPLITAKWGQGSPYNLQCPTEIPKGETEPQHCVTGCVATAMAQIMYYWQWPQEYTTAIPAYMNNKSFPELPPVKFDWSNMKSDYYGLETDASVDAVSTLMRYCGQAVKMNYGINGSDAFCSASPWVNYFNYEEGVSHIYRNQYLDSTWEFLIYAELQACRPVYYAGDSKNGPGHAFVCDGYDGFGKYHFNWGWDGSNNGFFRLSVLSPWPYSEYSRNQDAIIGIQKPNGDRRPYAVLSNNNTVLTFYYDNQKEARGGLSVRTFESPKSRGWDANKYSITSVVFDASFAGCTSLTSTAFWFVGCRNLTSIKGISYLKTDNVWDMSYMFSDCSGLTSLDLSGFITDNVANMSYMFDGCSGLTSLDLSGFRTDNVTNMDGMFYGCWRLTSLDLSGFITDNVANMSYMFDGCSGLTSLDLSGFITDNVRYMNRMFSGCSGLTSLDVSGFKTDNVTDMSSMFANCSGLTTIYAGDGWSTARVESSESMFWNCANLVGGHGTKFDSNHRDASYAHLDGGSSNPGYFTYKNATEVANSESYAVLSNNNTVLTFYYDNQKETRGGLSVRPFKSLESRGWDANTYSITSVVFDASFAGCTSLTSTALWFYGCRNLTSITGISYLKTDNVTDMSGMFYSCFGLTSLDVSGFITDNVADMSYMFGGCSGLTSLDLSGFITDNVANMSYMFDGCSGLTSLDLSGFITDNVRYMNRMFSGCSGLTSLDVSGFKTDNVRYMNRMFSGCSGLTSLDVSGFKTDNVTDMSGMFYSCFGLTSLDVSGFKTDNVTDMSGMFYNCWRLTSLDLSGFKTDNVRDMSTMFLSCSGLTSLDVSGFKTDNVADMSFMFWGCSGLTSLDVSGFKTDNVADMSYMFVRCRCLTSLDVSGFKTDNVRDMNNMFYGCSGLTSLDVSGFKTDNVANMFFMFAYCSGLTSLDLSGFKTDNVADMSYMFYGCSGLTTIYAGDGWSTARVESSESMFLNCANLVGGYGTKFDSNHTDASYAHVDGGISNPGYFSDKNAIAYTMGDANGDGEVNVSDIVEIVNYIMGKPSANFVMAAADLNGDGEINVTDIVMVVSIIMSTNNNSVSVRAAAMEMADNDRLTLSIDDDNAFSLCLDNEGQYVASQFDLRLTDGQKLESISLNGNRCDGHMITYTKTGDNRYKVVVYSLSNEIFAGNSGQLIDFKVTGRGNVNIENIIFVTAGHLEKSFAPLSSETTGIEGTDNVQFGSDSYFDLQGRRTTNGNKKGIYIKNGKKLVIK